MNWPGAHAISAAGRLKIRRPFLTSRSSAGGRSKRMSNTDVPKRSSVGLLPPLVERTSSCLGTVQSPIWRLSDCSGLKHQFSPKRSFRYCAENDQKDAYQPVLSPDGSSGRVGVYQPFITSRINPALRRRCRCVRESWLVRMATAPLSCNSLRADSESANFSDGWAMIVSRLIDRADSRVFCPIIYRLLGLTVSRL